MADKLWGREGSVEIRFLAPSVYLINFPSQKVRDWVLESGPWHIQQKALILRKWLPGMISDVISLDSAPIWVKLWHIPLELYSRQGLGYLASALGKPLYTDRSTALKNQLEYAKMCVDVEAKTILPASITVDRGNGNCVDVGVELDWATPCCSNCVVFGHSIDNCKKHVVSNAELQVEHIPSQVVQDTVEGIDHGSLVSGSVEVVVSSSGAGLGVGLGVVSHQAARVDGVGTVSSAQLVPGSVAHSSGQTLEDVRVDLASGQDGVSNVSANKFEVLCAVVDDQVVKDVLTRPERVAAGGITELMEKLKPKEKGRGTKKKRERGFNDPLKQKRVLVITRKLDIEILGLLETRVQVSNAAYIVQSRFAGWREDRRELWRELIAVKARIGASPWVLADYVRMEKEISSELRDLEKAEEKFYQQKSRALFVKEGDQNSAYFFRR
ncbi:hypothetical protein V6N13_142480 [Hibiscus sabdariffa]